MTRKDRSDTKVSTFEKRTGLPISVLHTKKTDIPKFTTAQKEGYLKSPNHCPVCGSESINAEHFDSEIPGEPVWCEDCGAKWNDVYKLVDIELISKGHGKITTNPFSQRK